MDESILSTIKRLMPIAEENTHFDEELITDINSVISTLTQIGVGPEDGYEITGADSKWSELLPTNSKPFSFVKSYIHLRVRLLFDTPQSSAAIEAINRQINELEFRISTAIRELESKEPMKSIDDTNEDS